MITTEERTPFKEINFRVLKTDSNEQFITKSLDNVQHSLEKMFMPAFFLLTLIPNIGGLLLGIVVTILDKSSRHNKMLAHIIVVTAERLDLENNINQFLSTMMHISRTLNRLSKNLSIHDDAELANIRRDLEIQIDNFDRKIGVYKKYPVISITPLFILYAYVVAFDRLFEVEKPHLAKFSQMTCDLNRMLFEYRHLIVYDRLNSIDVMGTYWFVQDKVDKLKTKLLPIIYNLPYNADGYNGANVTSIDCKKMGKIKFMPPRMMYINDSDHTFYNHKQPNDIEKCLADYMKYARHQVELFFEKPLRLTNRICLTKTKDPASVSNGNMKTFSLNIFSWIPFFSFHFDFVFRFTDHGPLHTAK